MLKAGDVAPDFDLKDTDGKRVKLSDLKGKDVVLYFYPKDDTPGCTKESCGFRDDISLFKARSAVVLGVSLDDQESHRRFTDKYSLNFPLLCDTDAKVSKTYGVYGEKNNYGKKYWGINRTTFIIDKEGKIKHVFSKVQVDTHSKDVLEVLGS
jgi:peroxiredoxin Q/BCP